MANSVKDELLQKMLRSRAGESLERKAEMTLQIARANKNVNAAEIIRDALYSADVIPKPGLLGLAIARLIVQYFPNVSVLTTNFDLLLETALQRYLDGLPVESYSVDSYQKWQNSEPLTNQLGVLTCTACSNRADGRLWSPPC